jgi:hypothetical protein
MNPKGGRMLWWLNLTLLAGTVALLAVLIA